MQSQSAPQSMQAKFDRGMTFLESVRYAADLMPGLAHDMRRLTRLRKDQARDMEGIGRIALSIPDPVWPLLEQFHPELFTSDEQQNGREWLRFMKHPDSAPFRVNMRL